MSIQGLQRLEVWRKAKEFALLVIQQVLPLLPPEEKWGLNQQMNREPDTPFESWKCLMIWIPTMTPPELLSTLESLFSNPSGEE